MNQVYVVESTVIKGRMYSLKAQFPCCTNQCAIQSVCLSGRTAVSHVGLCLWPSECQDALSTALLQHHVCFRNHAVSASRWRRDNGLTVADLSVDPLSQVWKQMSQSIPPSSSCFLARVLLWPFALISYMHNLWHRIMSPCGCLFKWVLYFVQFKVII